MQVRWLIMGSSVGERISKGREKMGIHYFQLLKLCVQGWCRRSGVSLSKKRRKTPSFSYGDIRRALDP
jgi:hypothetical protein